MDDVTFAARRATSVSRPEADIETRFRSLVQSPLRAGILRFLSARPGEAFDIESLMQTFGRLRLDIDNCVRELVEFGVVRKLPGDVPGYTAARPDGPVASLLDTFLERRAHVGVEESSPSVQRFREMIGRDEKMLAIFEWIRTAAKSDISVLILGPTGAGKEVVARMIHELSRRGQEVPGRQLRGAARHPVRVGDLRLRERGVHGRARSQTRPPRNGQRGHVVPGRGRRLVARGPGQAAARARRAPVRAARRQSIDLGGLPAHLRHQPPARFVRAREPVPRGPTTASMPSPSGCRR